VNGTKKCSRSAACWKELGEFEEPAAEAAMTYRKQELLFGLALLLIGSGLMYHTFDPSYAAMAADISVGPMFFPPDGADHLAGVLARHHRPRLPRRGEDVPFAWRKVLAALGVLLFFALFFSHAGFLPVGICCFFGLAWVPRVPQAGAPSGHQRGLRPVRRFRLQGHSQVLSARVQPLRSLDHGTTPA
jgi:hypothetical protein